MNRRIEFLLSVIYANNQEKIEGISRIQKITFIIQEETEINEYRFKPYDFGPWCKEIYTDMEYLMEGGYIYKDSEGNYSVTERGESYMSVFNQKYDHPQSKIKQIKQKYNDMHIVKVINKIYRKYPRMANESQLRPS